MTFSVMCLLGMEHWDYISGGKIMKAKEAYMLTVKNRKKNSNEFKKDKYFKYILKECRAQIKKNVEVGNFSAEFLFSSYFYIFGGKSVPKSCLGEDKDWMDKLNEKVVKPLKEDGYEVDIDGFMWPSLRISWKNAK